MALAFMAAAITGCKGALTPQDNTTIESMTIDVTPENIVNTILTLPASRTLKATGNFDSTTISNINAALKTLYQTSPSILVRLDLSATTGLTSIANFGECKNLEKIVIPNSVTSIGWYAFSGCTGLTSITIPDSVTSIGYRSFGDCTGLTSITIPDSVTSIGQYVFGGCTGLTSVTCKNTNGWKDSNGNPVSVEDPEAAATLLKEGDSLTRGN